MLVRCATQAGAVVGPMPNDVTFWVGYRIRKITRRGAALDGLDMYSICSNVFHENAIWVFQALSREWV